MAKSTLNKEKLQQSLETLIENDQSLHNLTVSDIAKKAGISRPLFYKFYSDKYDLLRSCFLKIQEGLADQDGFWQKINAYPSQEDVRCVINEIAEAYHTHIKFLVAIRDVSRTDSSTRDMFLEMNEWRVSKLKEHIEKGQTDGWINPQLIPRETAILLTSAGFRSFEQAVETGDCTLDDFVNAYTEYLFKILYK